MFTKFLVYLDYLSGNPISSEYVEISSNKLEDAIATADRMFNGGKHYLISIMKKTSLVTRLNGVASAEYIAVMNRRDLGWYLCTDDGGEPPHKVERCCVLNANYSAEPWYNER